MGRKGYPEEVRLRAKALWLSGTQSDAQIAVALGISRVDTIGQWRRQESWDRDRKYVQQVTEQRVQEAVAETIADMNARHLKEYQLLQTKGIHALRRLDPQKAAEAQTMVDAGIRGERLVRGEPTEVTEVRALMRVNVQVLEFCVADVLKVLLDKKLIDKKVAKQFADLFAEKVNGAPFRYTVEGQK